MKIIKWKGRFVSYPGEKEEKGKEMTMAWMFLRSGTASKSRAVTHAGGLRSLWRGTVWTRAIFTQFPYKEQSSIASHPAVDSAGASPSECIPVLRSAVAADGHCTPVWLYPTRAPARQGREPEAEALWARTWRVPPSPGEIGVTHLKPWVNHLNMCASLGGVGGGHVCLLSLQILITRFFNIMIRE